MKKYDVAIVGASGMVGRELLDLIKIRRFPVNKIYFFNSGKNKISFIEFKNKKYECFSPQLNLLEKAKIVFFVSTEEISRKYAPILASKKIWCIDDSSEFRLDPSVPLIIPEINSELIKKSYLIAGPNCTLTPLAVSCFNIHKKFQIEEIRVATYQAVSGAGRKAIESLFEELEYYLKNKKMKSKNKFLPNPIAFNIFPQVGSFDKNGISSEEKKVELELKKIWNSPDIKISVTAVRVPTIRVHCLSAWIKTKKDWELKDIEKTFINSKGVKYLKNPKYATPLNSAKTFEVFVSRLRKTPIKNEFQVWLSGDNLYKGAALNSIQIAEKIIEENYG